MVFFLFFISDNLSLKHFHFFNFQVVWYRQTASLQYKLRKTNNSLSANISYGGYLSETMLFRWSLVVQFFFLGQLKVCSYVYNSVFIVEKGGICTWCKYLCIENTLFVPLNIFTSNYWYFNYKIDTQKFALSLKICIL